MKKIISLFAILLICVSLTGCGLVKDDIYILVTGDVHGNLTNVMNYANLKAYEKELKKETEYVALVDAGDYSEGSNWANNSKGSAIIDLMNDTGYDVATLGNHEFDFDLEQLKENIDNSKFDVVCANVEYTGDGSNPFENVKPYVIKNYGGTKIAFIGVTSVNAMLEKDVDREHISENGQIVVDMYGDPNNPEDDGTELCNHIQDVVNEVRDKVDYVIVISHLGTNKGQLLNSLGLIRYTNGIDLVIDGHAHNSINELKSNKDEEMVPIISTGTEFIEVGLIKINLDGTIETSYIDSMNVIDTSLQEKIDNYRVQYE